MELFSARLGTKEHLPQSWGQQSADRVAQDAVVPVCKCLWTFLLGVCGGTLHLEILIPTILRNHIVWEASFDSLVSSSNKLRWFFSFETKPVNLMTWCHKFSEVFRLSFFFFFGATAGVRTTQFDFSVTKKLFPTWRDSSSIPTGRLSDGFEDAKCQDLSQLI